VTVPRPNAKTLKIRLGFTSGILSYFLLCPIVNCTSALAQECPSTINKLNQCALTSLNGAFIRQPQVNDSATQIRFSRCYQVVPAINVIGAGGQPAPHAPDPCCGEMASMACDMQATGCSAKSISTIDVVAEMANCGKFGAPKEKPKSAAAAIAALKKATSFALPNESGGGGANAAAPGKAAEPAPAPETKNQAEGQSQVTANASEQYKSAAASTKGAGAAAGSVADFWQKSQDTSGSFQTDLAQRLGMAQTGAAAAANSSGQSGYQNYMSQPINPPARLAPIYKQLRMQTNQDVMTRGPTYLANLRTAMQSSRENIDYWKNSAREANQAAMDFGQMAAFTGRNANSLGSMNNGSPIRGMENSGVYAIGDRVVASNFSASNGMSGLTEAGSEAKSGNELKDGATPGAKDDKTSNALDSSGKNAGSPRNASDPAKAEDESQKKEKSLSATIEDDQQEKRWSALMAEFENAKADADKKDAALKAGLGAALTEEERKREAGVNGGAAALESRLASFLGFSLGSPDSQPQNSGKPEGSGSEIKFGAMANALGGEGRGEPWAGSDYLGTGVSLFQRVSTAYRRCTARGCVSH
jgi:hypothetical protein